MLSIKEAKKKEDLFYEDDSSDEDTIIVSQREMRIYRKILQNS